MPHRDEAPRPKIAALIQRVIGDTSAAFRRGNPAVEELATRGAPAVRAALKAMRGPVPPGGHARDMVEALGIVLRAIARRDAAPLIDVLERNAAPADPELMFLVGALEAGRKRQVLEPLIRALKHPSPVVRWSAAGALVRLRRPRATGPLTDALRDRSSMVHGTVVFALRDSKFYRTPAAIEPLRRIVRNQRTKKQLPGLWQAAREVLATLEREFPNP
jgi:HEAT repeat protein